MRDIRYSDYFTDVALGLFSNESMGKKFGRNPQIDTTSDPEDIWGGGGLYTGHPVNFTPEKVEVFSSDGTDDAVAVGAGAWTIRIVGLKTATSTYYETEDFILDGAVAVDSLSTWWRVNRAYVLTAGSGGANAGTITIRSKVTTANVFAQLPIGQNQTQIMAYTVPFGKRIVIKSVRISIAKSAGAAGSAVATIRAREPGGVYRAIGVHDVVTTAPTFYQNLGGNVLAAGTDLKITIESVSSSSMAAEGSIEYYLLNEQI